MKQLNLILILLLAGTLWTEGAFAACGYPTKKMAIDDAKSLTEEIKKKMGYANVDEEVESLRAIFEGCDVSPASFGLGRGVLDFWKKKGRESTKDCNPIRLDQKGGPMEHMPVMDQGRAGICYAYGAAQMIDAYRFAHGDKRKDHLTSVFQLAALYKAKDPDSDTELSSREGRNTLDGGWADKSIEAALSFGSCSRDFTEDSIDSGDTYKKIERLVASYNANKLPGSDIEKNTERLLCEFDVQTNVAPELARVLQGIQKALGYPSSQSYLFGLINTICMPPHNIPIRPKAKIVKVSRTDSLTVGSHKEKIEDMLNSTLDAMPPTPVSVSYCSGVLRDKNFRGIRGLFGPDSGALPVRDCDGGHSSVIIGRRVDPKSGQCQYLLRNSWGTTCHPYPDYECENGNVWIEKKALLNNVSSAFRMEKE